MGLNLGLTKFKGYLGIDKIKSIYLGVVKILASKKINMIAAVWNTSDYYIFDLESNTAIKKSIDSRIHMQGLSVDAQNRVLLCTGEAYAGHIHLINDDGSLTLLGSRSNVIFDAILYNGYWYISTSDGSNYLLCFGATIESAQSVYGGYYDQRYFLRIVNNYLIWAKQSSSYPYFEYCSSNGVFTRVTTPYCPYNIIFTGDRYFIMTPTALYLATSITGPFSGLSYQYYNVAAHGDGKTLFGGANDAAVYTYYILDGSNTLTNFVSQPEVFYHIIFNTIDNKFYGVGASGTVYRLEYTSYYYWSAIISSPYSGSYAFIRNQVIE